MRLLVYAFRDWSFKNAEPSLDLGRIEYERWWFEKEPMPDLSKFDGVITCEPHIDGWRKAYSLVSSKLPIIALQQTLYWVDVIRPNSSWLFDWFLVWGEQMADVAIAHGCGMKKIRITGSPRFDAFFSTRTEDHGFTLILGGGGGDHLATYPKLSEPFMYIPHPTHDNGRMYSHSEEMIRTAGRVMFRTTGGGIIPMIMKKPVRIMPLTAINDTSRMNGYLRFYKSKLYGKDEYGVDDEFVRWAVTGPGASKRVLEAIEDHICK